LRGAVVRLEREGEIMGITARQLSFSRTSLAVTAMLLAAAPAVAQDPAEVVDIRRLYESVGKRVEGAERGEDGQIYSTELVVSATNQSWPATGIYQVRYAFHFERADGEAMPSRLVKVATRTEASARHYASEYLFDETGALVFHFASAAEESGLVETRVYFVRGRPIRVVRAGKVSDRLTPEERDVADEAARKAQQLKAFFAAASRLPDE
jgi:hypothetical protein